VRKLIGLSLLQILSRSSVLFGRLHPEVLLGIADDLAKTRPCSGYPRAQTPNVDRLAATEKLEDAQPAQAAGQAALDRRHALHHGELAREDVLFS